MTPFLTWKALGIKPTTDRTEIRRAYARLLKVTNPEDDADGFKNLREAYESALQLANAPQSADAQPDFRQPDFAKSGLADPIAAKTPDTPAGVSYLQADYQAACDRLEALLAPDSEADDETLLDALIIVLTAPFTENPSAARSAETWLVRLLLTNQPRSDVLVSPVAAHFGWTKQLALGEAGSDAADKQAMLRRASNIAFLRRVQKPDDAYHYAFSILTRPPASGSLIDFVFDMSTRDKVAECLGRIRRHHPDLEAELNPRTVATWDDRLNYPRMSPMSAWMAVISVPSLLAMAVCAFLPTPAFGAALLIGIIPVTWTVVRIVYVCAIVLPRLKWLSDPRRDAKPWLAFGWAPATGLLLFVATVPLPVGAAIAMAIIGLLIVGWTMIAGEPDRSAGNWPWRLRVVVAEMPLLVWLFTSLHGWPGATGFEMSTAVITAIFVAGYGRLPLQRLWFKLADKSRDASLLALAGACALTVAGLAASLIYAPVFPVIFAAGVLLKLTQGCFVQGARSASPVWPLTGIAVLVAMVAGMGGALAAVIYGIIVVGHTGLDALMERQKRPAGVAG